MPRPRRRRRPAAGGAAGRRRRRSSTRSRRCSRCSTRRRTRQGRARTILSKVLHRKRPDLVPLYDSRIFESYTAPGAIERSAHRSWRDSMTLLLAQMRADLQAERGVRRARAGSPRAPARRSAGCGSWTSSSGAPPRPGTDRGPAAAVGGRAPGGGAAARPPMWRRAGDRRGAVPGRAADRRPACWGSRGPLASACCGRLLTPRAGRPRRSTAGCSTSTPSPRTSSPGTAPCSCCAWPPACCRRPGLAGGPRGHGVGAVLGMVLGAGLGAWLASRAGVLGDGREAVLAAAARRPPGRGRTDLPLQLRARSVLLVWPAFAALAFTVLSVRHPDRQRRTGGRQFGLTRTPQQRRSGNGLQHLEQHGLPPQQPQLGPQPGPAVGLGEQPLPLVEVERHASPRRGGRAPAGRPAARAPHLAGPGRRQRVDVVGERRPHRRRQHRRLRRVAELVRQPVDLADEVGPLVHQPVQREALRPDRRRRRTSRPGEPCTWRSRAAQPTSCSARAPLGPTSRPSRMATTPKRRSARGKLQQVLDEVAVALLEHVQRQHQPGEQHVPRGNSGSRSDTHGAYGGQPARRLPSARATARPGRRRPVRWLLRPRTALGASPCSPASTCAGVATSTRRTVLPRAAVEVGHAVELVRPVVDDVRDRGAQAVLEATERFDGVAADRAARAGRGAVGGAGRAWTRRCGPRSRRPRAGPAPSAPRSCATTRWSGSSTARRSPSAGCRSSGSGCTCRAGGSPTRAAW